MTDRLRGEGVGVGVPTVLSVFGTAPRRIGGGESYARELSLQVARHGWRSVLCFNEEPRGAVREYLQLPNVEFAVLSRPELSSLRSARALSALLRRYRPQILHLYLTGFLSPYPWLARAHGVRKVLFTDQTSRPEGHVVRRAPAWKRLATRIINAPLDHVVCVSEYGRGCLRGRDVLPGERYVLAYNAVDLGRARGSPEAAAALRSRLAIPPGRSIVAQVSWLIPEKGIHDLLHAARLVLDRRRDVQFLFVGDGDDGPRFEALARDLGIDGHVTWAGLVGDPPAEGVYALADVVCQMSRWEEVFGFVIAEAMGCERPVIGTRVGGIPELIEDGRTGFLVARGDRAAMAERILRLLADPEQRRHMGRAARETAEARFDLRTNVARVVALYGAGRPLASAAAASPAESGEPSPSRRHRRSGDPAHSVAPSRS